MLNGQEGKSVHSGDAPWKKEELAERKIDAKAEVNLVAFLGSQLLKMAFLGSHIESTASSEVRQPVSPLK